MFIDGDVNSVILNIFEKLENIEVRNFALTMNWVIKLIYFHFYPLQLMEQFVIKKYFVFLKN